VLHAYNARSIYQRLRVELYGHEIEVLVGKW